MSLSDLHFGKRKKKRKKTVIFVIVLLSSIITSATFAGIVNEVNKTDTSGIWISSNGSENETSTYQKITADHSQESEDRIARAVNPLKFEALPDVENGHPIGDEEDTIQSDGKYFSAISELHQMDWIGSADKLNDAGGFNTVGGEVITENKSIDLVGLVDNDGINSLAAVPLDETAEIYQVYRLRGSSYYWYDLLKTANAENVAKYWDDDFEKYAEDQNFHTMMSFPTYLTDINFTISLKFSDLSFPTSALPKSYRISFYNHFLDKWDEFRVENTTFIDTYAQGIYQEDEFTMNRENANFEAYFDPTDRMSMLMRINLEFEYRSYSGGNMQEIDVDAIEYSYASESEAIIINLGDHDAPENTSRDTWRRDPKFLLECKTNSTTRYEDDVIIARSDLISGSASPLPFGIFDNGIDVNTSSNSGLLYTMDESAKGMPRFSIAILTREKTKVDIDWMEHTFFPSHNITCSSRWYANESSIASEMGKVKEIVWETNITTSPTEIDALLSFPIDHEVVSIRTPHGEELTDIFDVENPVEIFKEMTDILGHGTYQVITKSSNYINFSSVTDSAYDPIAQTTYTSPVRHITQIINFDQLKTVGKLGFVNVSFVTKSGDTVFHNETDVETFDLDMELFKGQTVFPGSSVGVVDCMYVWTNGESVGIYITQFVMVGQSTDAPFIKIFNPMDGEHVNEDAFLYVAIVTIVPEDLGYALDGSLSWGKFKKGFYQGFQGTSDLLKDYTYFSTIPVDVMEHDTNHFITVRAFEGLNGKKTERETDFRIDKETKVSIGTIPLAYDDGPIPVQVIVDADVELLTIFLDNNVIGRLRKDDIGNEIIIPKLNSGTYFLDLKARDELGNIGTDTASFFVAQSNPTPWGTLMQWIGDFFKIFFIMLVSIFGGLGIAVYAKKKGHKGKTDVLCPDGTKKKGGVCEVDL